MSSPFSHSDRIESPHLTGNHQAPAVEELEQITSAILARINAVTPTICDHQQESDESRALPETSYRALRETGALHIAIPRRYGGYETSIASQLRVSAAVGAIDGSAGWVTAVLNAAAWGMSIFDRRAQDDVFEDNDCAVCGVLMPNGMAIPVEGGYRVSGRWPYASGSDHATWASLAVLVNRDNGMPVDIAAVLLPRADYRIEDTWFSSGMRRTASNTIVAQDVFVPAYRTASLRDAARNSSRDEYREHPLYRAAPGSVLSLALVGPLLGMGRAALDLVIARSRSRGIAYTGYARQADSVSFQLQLARAASKIDTAHLHAYRAAGDIDDAARLGDELDISHRGRIRSDCAAAAESITEALNILMFAHGASGFASASPLQRIWSDANIAARHALMLPEINYEIYGKVLLGLEDRVIELTPTL